MPPTSCQSCPLRKRSIFSPFTKDELTFMQSFKTGELTVEPGTTILMEGSNSPQLFTVLSGMGTRYTTLENGRRQVINFLFPGDFAGLQAGLQHSVEATTDMTLCVFRRDELWRLFRSHPDRAYDLTWIAAVEEHFLGETIATLGQRDAAQRIAWALVRMYDRLKAVGLETAGRVPLPFRQQDLADALGLSLVHTNKTLKTLRSKGLARWKDGHLEVKNPGKLADLALVEHEKPQRRPLM
ncbi:cAMP-binding domain of CRP or a regulatory subunit of cAMP-dependent protein kinases [Cribrihabitans marinus]|uniref:cAMP-binding domain of CRP or a regulatory subunit of cAMP-dependent protein kinases n=1 Tax=Cribrihabitans marinus TaxID=1227549 RepID=A0A1H7BIT4_9RHOB|nr:Crp/Fnr family transcriptional regulator [Cribrihabitans marinus]GGH34656.1 Crp/Fnr family transcriptional regulator [Cribrihabitans marinus]SEJ76247.1 cAMP-binding domain of CRP or a regulatory subunit of cAMP-dependent protein kinases [Cribrihabitans marinus]